MIKLKNKLKKKTTWSLFELADKSVTWSYNQDNLMKNKLNKNKKLNYQTNLILNDKTKKKKKDLSQPHKKKIEKQISQRLIPNI